MCKIIKNYSPKSKNIDFWGIGCKKISAANRVEFESREEAVEEDYVPCQVSNP